ncbi:caspase domain-containing protein [Achaetomium macrosporum]|uniref:Caspase domain-containing protein n=1 Tax=Achaetomium macrosporum TaxID=79813 RepID=A0AAN7C1X8_9PEZI|nr:caspase domain-containing protein [Achaetomium macrosporum]
MIETTEAAMTRRAVLIGINYYVKDRCLQGCVRDVTDIKHTLDNDNSPTSASILVLTATTPADQSSVRPLEEPTAWPTYDNVSKALNSIKERSRPGDFVYIHYSGHGTRLPNGQMALVLYNADLNTPYSSFPGRLLGGLLQRLAAKGVFVTLVLDCCFSGGILRSDNLQGAEARSIDYNPLLDAHADQDANKLPMDVEHTFRDSSIHLENWLVNPEGYTILSATSPYDTAWELTLNETGERRGALSYFLIRGLNRVRQRALTPTNGMLYQHLRTLFHAHWPKQCPMRYGNQDIAFFGCPRGPPDTGFVSIFKTGLGQLCLAAGQAHGVQVGDEYAAYPFDFEAPSQLRDSPIMVRVDKVQPMTSILVEINQARADTERPGIESGWKGKLATPLPRYVFSIGILRDIGDSLVRSHIPGQHPYLHLSHPPDRKGRACIFNVTVNERNEYEILDGYHQRLWSLPTIPWNDQHPVETHKTVLDILQHLARFKYLEEIDNRIPDPAFENSFSLITIPTSEPGVSGNFEVNHGDEWGFIIENVGETNLYVALLDFGPSWQIADLFSNAYKSGFIVVPPKSNWDAGREEVRLTMEVPERLRSRGHNQCEDVIKVFFILPKEFAVVHQVSILVAKLVLSILYRVDHEGSPRCLSANTTDINTVVHEKLGTLSWLALGTKRQLKCRVIEDYPNGYPRYSALIASHDTFQICRRFTRLRTRLLLVKQDKLSVLEKQLDKLDRDEDVLLRLGSSREDDNPQRQSVLAQIDNALADYDTFIERTDRMLAFEVPEQRHVTNLRNWTDGNRCIARAETEYLTRNEWDLLKAASHNDNALAWLETLVVDALVWIRKPFSKHDCDGSAISRDPHVHIFSKTAISRSSRILMIPFITTLLIAPVVICNSLNNLLARLIVIVLSTSGFISVLSGLTRARTVELVIAGAT